MDERETNEIAALAVEDQRVAEARTAAKAVTTYWSTLSGEMDDELRRALTICWQEAQFRWIPMVSEFEDDDYF